MAEQQKLDLSTPEAKTAAAQALPALLCGAAFGNSRASAMAGQIIGQAFSDELQPSFDALARLAAWHDEMQRFEQTGRLYQGPCWCSSCAAAELEKGDDR